MKPIQVGDLVIVIKPRECGCANSVGKVFTVKALITTPTHCDHCGLRNLALQVVATGLTNGGVNVNRLLRIEPKVHETYKEDILYEPHAL